MELIPAIDLLNGHVVRLHQGRYDDVTVYSDDPIRAAREFASDGAPRLHVVDLGAAKSGEPMERALAQRLVREAGIPVQVGGGIRNLDAVKHWLLEVGADRVVLGTAAVRDPKLVNKVCAAFPDRIVVAIDARKGEVATDGWLASSGVRAEELARRVDDAGVAAILYTDIERDGTGEGAAVEATAALQRTVRATVIASGGVGSVADLVALSRAGVRSAVSGRAIWARSFSYREAIQALRASAESS